MDSDDLTHEQARLICERVDWMRRYLLKLRKRMISNGLPADHPLHDKIGEVQGPLFKLWVDLHYRSCGQGLAGRSYPIAGDDNRE
jgi:hypothetical protein